MQKLIHNLNSIVTTTAKDGWNKPDVQTGAGILIENDSIKAVGVAEELLKKSPGAEKIDGKNCLALPGFVDPHTHPVFYKTREEEFEMRIQGKSYEEIAAAGGGIRNSVRAFREASFEEIAKLTYRRIRKFLEYGTTTIEAKSGYGLSLIDELKALRVLKKLSQLIPITIVPTFLGAHEVPDEYRNNREKYIEILINEMIPAVAEEKLAVFCDVFCEKNVFSVAESEKILLAATDHGLIPKLHADELHPTGGAELAAKVKAISADHLLMVSQRGIEKMKDAGVIPVLLPGTAFFLGKKEYAPARKMIGSGLPVALATDFNPGSSMTQNMQLILTIAAINMKMIPAELIGAATLNSARAVAMEKEAGSIEPGKKADIILLDIPDYKYLPYHYGINHVKMVIRHGQVVHQAD
ncbi:MAG: imidazolonepropionase [Calditrichia bacterium]